MTAGDHFDNSLPTVPSDEAKIAALKELEAKILALLDGVRAKLPAAAQVPVQLAEVVVQKALDGLAGDFANLKANITAELVELVTTGKSEVRHDPTELA